MIQRHSKTPSEKSKIYIGEGGQILPLDIEGREKVYIKNEQEGQDMQ